MPPPGRRDYPSAHRDRPTGHRGGRQQQVGRYRPIDVRTLDQVDVLVTNAGLAAEARRIISEHVGQLIVAQPLGYDADNKPRKVTSL